MDPLQMALFIQGLLITFGGLFPFIPQYMTIRKSRNAHGFSIYVCFLLIVANSLRIAFRLGKEYPTVLFLQSIIMIMTMLVMLSLAVEIRSSNILTSSANQPHKFRGNLFLCINLKS
ncbi:PQ-loop repeat-containing protein 1 [Cichlidogyrus casuarinus]|uniref:PQ-loop repeat-containing protein 1 n=1 Tax=Cichlidogyrus casuarinus TaxID=1844966 RepID=A0ABD2QKR3_9PLAT